MKGIWIRFLTFAAMCGIVLAEYQLVKGKYDFVEAMHACSNLGDEWQLPDGQALGRGLLDVMDEHRITSTWLSVFRRTFEKWQWVDGKPDSTFGVNTTHKYCAMLKLTGEIIPTTCVSQGIGLVCQLPDAVPCPDQRSCFNLNHTNLFIDCKRTDWYGARSVCLNYGGDLVVLDTTYKVQQVAKRLSDIENTMHCQKAFVGLYRENWLAIDPNDEGRVLFTTKWGLGEPSPLQHRRCTEAVRNLRGLETWKARSCPDLNNAICYREGNPKIPSVVKTTVSSSSVTSTKKPTTISLESLKEQNRRISIFEICVSAIGSTLGILIILSIIYCYVRRRKKRRIKLKNIELSTSEAEHMLSEKLETKQDGDLSASCTVSLPKVSQSDEKPTAKNRENDLSLHLPGAQSPSEPESKSVSIKQDPVSEIEASSESIGVLLCCGGVLSCKIPNKIIPVKSIRFIKKETEPSTISIDVSRLQELTFYHLRCNKGLLDLEETRTLIKFLKKNEGGLKIVYLPGLTFDADNLKNFRDISQRVICLCIAYYETSREIAAECISLGFVHGDFLERNSNIYGSGLLDLTLRVAGDPVKGTDAVHHAVRVIGHIANLYDRVDRGEQSALGYNATGSMRRKLIDSITTSKRPDHHPVRGFGLLAVENQRKVYSSVEETRTFTPPLKRPVRVGIVSTGWDARRRIEGVESWKVTALGDGSIGDRDTAWYRGTESINLLIRDLELTGVDKTKVDILYDIIDTREGKVDWHKYTETLQRIGRQKLDIIFLSAGFGTPPSNSSVHDALHDLQTNSIVITGSICMKTNHISADFPSESVISIRNGYKELESPFDSTVDFDVTPHQELNKICNGSWAGAIRVTALTSRILLLLFQNWNKLSNSVFTEARRTVGMREILKKICSRAYSPDSVKIINPEMPLSVAMIEKVKTCLENNKNTSNTEFYYWTGKRV